MNEAANWVRVASARDIPAGEMLGVQAGGKQIAVFHLEDGGWAAIDNVCTHAFALLTDGWLDGAVIECPLHAARFDVTTGKVLGPPADEDLATYPVRLDGDAVMLAVPE